MDFIDTTNSAGGIKVTDRTKPAVIVTASVELEYRHECLPDAEVFAEALKALVNDQVVALVMKRMQDRSTNMMNAEATPAHQVYIDIKHA